MKKRTLNEEINRIKKLNELFADDNDDYLYDPEYYEKNMEDDENEPSPQYDENGELIYPPDFEEDLTLSSNRSSMDVSPEISNSNKSEDIEKSKNSIEHYDIEKTNKIYDLLSSNSLNRHDIHDSILQYMIKDRMVKSKNNIDDKYKVFGFNMDSNGRAPKIFNSIKYQGMSDSTPANRGIISDKNKFHIFINNVIDIDNKKSGSMTHKDRVNDIENEYRNRWQHTE